MNILTKLLLTILSVSALVYGASIGYISINAKMIAVRDAKKLTRVNADKYANIISANLNTDVNTVRSMAQSFTGYKLLPIAHRNEIYNSILKSIITKNPDYCSSWMSWELSAIDKSYKKSHGRIRSLFYRQNNEIKFGKDSLDLKNHNSGKLYYKIKMSGKETITNPYFYTYCSDKVQSDSVLEISICVPILNNEKFVGLTGIDVPLKKYQQIINNIDTTEIEYILLANNGTYIRHTDNKIIGLKMADIQPDLNAKYNVSHKIKQGQEFEIEEDGKIHIFSAIKFGNATAPWSICMIIPIKSITQNADENFKISLIISGISLLIIGLILVYTGKKFIKPLQTTTRILTNLSKGKVTATNSMSVKSNDIIGKMRQSVNVLIESLKSTTVFATKIGKGDYDAQYTLLSNHDDLGNSLLEMKQSLKNAKELYEKRQIENENKNWIAQGITKFNELFRENISEIEGFDYQFISMLSKHINAQQGVFYIIDPGKDKHLRFSACFACDKNTRVKKRIEIGESIVGRCVLEKESIYINNVPKNYIQISSGLGSETPNNLLVIPLIYNDEVLGAIELAAFKPFYNHHIEFVERIGETAASKISDIRINQTNINLLKESRVQSEEFSAREEELMQLVESIQNNEQETKNKLEKAKKEIKKLKSKLEKQNEKNKMKD